MKLILASNSKDRKKILDNLHIDYEVIPSNIEENSSCKNVYDYVMDLSKQKASNVYKRTNGLVIACDTVIFCDNKILEKPKDLNEAFEMLKNLSGKTSSAYTGVTIMVDDKVNTFYEKTDFTFSTLSDTDIKWYLENGSNITSRAGGFSVSNEAMLFIENVQGDFYNIVGLPLNRLFRELKNMGYNIYKL